MARNSSRERMRAALLLEEHDHVPFSPYIGNWANFGEPFMWNSQVERAHRMLKLGADPVIDIWLPRPVPSGEVAIRERRVKQDHEVLLTKEYHTPAGVLRQVVRETDDWCTTRHGPWIPTTWGVEKRTQYNMDLFDDYNVSRRKEPWVKGREDLDKLRYVLRPVDGHELDAWRMDAERAMEYAQRMDLLTMSRRTIVGDAFQWLCDIPWFLMQLIEDPEFVTEFFAILQEWSLRMVELALEVGVDVVQYRGWYEISTFWGPDLWSKYLKPLIAEQARLTHEAGALFSYLLPEGHGAYAEGLRALEDLDVCQGIDPRMLHGGTAEELFDRIGNNVAFWGGVNAEITLTQDADNYEQIAREVAAAVKDLDGNNGLILSAFLFEEVPLAGITNMLTAWKTICKVE